MFAITQANVLPTRLSRHRNRKRDPGTKRKFSLRTARHPDRRSSLWLPSSGSKIRGRKQVTAACSSSPLPRRVLRAAEFPAGPRCPHSFGPTTQCQPQHPQGWDAGSVCGGLQSPTPPPGNGHTSHPRPSQLRKSGQNQPRVMNISEDATRFHRQKEWLNSSTKLFTVNFCSILTDTHPAAI